jgi:cytochrome c6
MEEEEEVRRPVEGPATAAAPNAARSLVAAASFVATGALGGMVALVPLPPAAVAAVAPDATTRGAELFKAECAGCHLGGQNFMSEKKTLKKEALQQFQSLDAGKLTGFVQSQMPHSFLPFHAKFSDQDFGDVIGYVLDQAVNDKWE